MEDTAVKEKPTTAISTSSKQEKKSVIDNVLESLFSEEKNLKMPPRSHKTTYERPRSCSTKPSSRKIRQHRTFNEKDLIRPISSMNTHRGSLSEKKTTPILTTNKPPQQQSATKSTAEKQSAYNRPGNRVSFQPSTEFLKHYSKGVGMAKQGAATASGIKRAASTSLALKKGLLLPKSESAASCLKNDQAVKRQLAKNKLDSQHHHTVNISKLLKATTRNMSTLELNVSANLVNARHYADKEADGSNEGDEDASDCSTIGDVKVVASGKRAVSGPGVCKLTKKFSLNVPRNISKSVDSMLSCLPSEEMGKKSGPEGVLK